MTGSFLKRVRLLLVCALFGLPAAGYAQDAALTGTVTDATGGVLPGVTVTATNEATGNTFVGVTDGTGAFRIPVRVGAYRISAELQGFTTVQRTGVQLLVGQTIDVDMQMNPSTVQETVTVSAEAPLIEVTTSALGGNIDPTQVQELPVQGRNWMALALLAPGSRTTPGNQNNPLPDRNDGEVREYQLHIDGQQVTQDLGTGVQPRYSQDSIAEFQFISNRFDATMGRSSGVQVKAITRSGTNNFSGLFRANFRDDRFNAEDPVVNRVLPMNNQQYSTAIGGPIVRDRLHYFGNFEYERAPKTSVWRTPFPQFNVQLSGKETIKMGGGRLDYQVSPNTRLMGKWHEGRRYDPFGAGGSNHPAATGSSDEASREALGQLTQVFSNAIVSEVKVGYSEFGFDQGGLTNWSRHWQASNGVTGGSPRIRFTGFDITPNQNFPRRRAQNVWSLREDLALSYEANGRHDMRAGVEYLHRREDSFNRRLSGGEIDARGGPLPANLPALLPDAFNVDTWNLAALSSITRSYRIGVGDFSLSYTQPKFGAWVQDDWRIGDRLTLNLGLRWDLSINASANDIAVPPFLAGDRPNDRDNFQPRVGFAYSLDDRTVIRGGTGLYYYEPITSDTLWTVGNSKVAVIQINNDGRPNFAADPFNGRPLPTFEEASRLFCHVNRVAGCLRNSLQELVAEGFSQDLGYTLQNSIGVARQFGNTMALEVDYVYTRGRNEKDIIDNVNLTYNPATGANYPFSDINRRAFPDWGNISLLVRTGRSAYHGLQTSFVKRMSHRWQASATYTLSGLWDAESAPFTGDPATSRFVPVPFTTAADMGGEWALSESDQRHRFVFNSIWEVGRGFQVSGLVYHGSGIRDASFYGGDLRNTGTDFSMRLRPDGSLVPRNTFLQPDENRVDVRLQQRLPLGGGRSVDLIAETFNLFNANNFVLIAEEGRRDFRRPETGQNRTMQFGFRVAF
ncbi:MAG: TonB-dependent receptor [Acidimicrobiia bacterium]|nr:TonB-dependent receptor [Acidimicrobiia bacterium]